MEKQTYVQLDRIETKIDFLCRRMGIIIGANGLPTGDFEEEEPQEEEKEEYTIPKRAVRREDE